MLNYSPLGDGIEGCDFLVILLARVVDGNIAKNIFLVGTSVFKRAEHHSAENDNVEAVSRKLQQQRDTYDIVDQ